jgi:2-polyprenyl-3-methyl-5-hydroxy-6-metoxy-1,4-benzoquinol methylase
MSQPEYAYQSAESAWANEYLSAGLRKILQAQLARGAQIFELGCGNGVTAKMLSDLGYGVTAVDPSSSGVRAATAAYPSIRFAERSAYDDLAGEFGTFEAVVSLEVIEHCYFPRHYADTTLALLKPGGLAIISTPYHGYLKNLALALSGKMDAHFTALWDGGHIKFWSERTLRTLLEERGFVDISFQRVGRIGPLAKSMIALARKPAR